MNKHSSVFENIYNKEKFNCANQRDVKIIDGIEYLRVIKEGTAREVLMRRDSLKKVTVAK